jgi:hypothetical protein
LEAQGRVLMARRTRKVQIGRTMCLTQALSTSRMFSVCLGCLTGLLLIHPKVWADHHTTISTGGFSYVSRHKMKTQPLKRGSSWLWLDHMDLMLWVIIQKCASVTTTRQRGAWTLAKQLGFEHPVCKAISKVPFPIHYVPVKYIVHVYYVFVLWFFNSTIHPHSWTDPWMYTKSFDYMWELDSILK